MSEQVTTKSSSLRLMFILGAFLLNVPSKSITSSRNVIGLKSPWSGDQGPGVSEDLSNLLGQASYMSWNMSLLTRPMTPVPVDSQDVIKRPLQQQNAAKSDVAFSPGLLRTRAMCLFQFCWHWFCLFH